MVIIVKWKVSGGLWEKTEKEKIIEPHKIAVKWLFMTSNRYKTTLMYIFVVSQESHLQSEFLKMRWIDLPNQKMSVEIGKKQMKSSCL